jgi:hypothetical protein
MLCIVGGSAAQLLLATCRFVRYLAPVEKLAAQWQRAGDVAHMSAGASKDVRVKFGKSIASTSFEVRAAFFIFFSLQGPMQLLDGVICS